MSRVRRRREVEEPRWLDDAIRDDRGHIVGNVANALLALRENPAISECFAYDEMRRTVMLTKRIPGKTARQGDNRVHATSPVKDTDATALQEHLNVSACRASARKRSSKPSRSTLTSAASILSATISKVSFGTARSARRLAREVSRRRQVARHRCDWRNVSGRNGRANFPSRLSGRLHACAGRQAGNGQIVSLSHPWRRVLFRCVARRAARQGSVE